MKALASGKKLKEEFDLSSYYYVISGNGFRIKYKDVDISVCRHSGLCEDTINWGDGDGDVFKAASVLQLSKMLGESPSMDGFILSGNYDLEAKASREDKVKITGLFCLVVIVIVMMNDMPIDLTKNIEVIEPINEIFIQHK